MEVKGLTFSYLFEASSVNYGEAVGNTIPLKKLTRGNGEVFTYISRQTLRHEIVKQLPGDAAPLQDEGVIQFHPEANIANYPEIDLFGYLKTKRRGEGRSRSREARVTLSHAVSVEPYQGDSDFMTNGGLLERYNNSREEGEQLPGGSIIHSEHHHSLYAVTVTIDLDRVGIDQSEGEMVDNQRRYERVCAVLDALQFLSRPIRGRNENLAPVFAVGGVYRMKSPLFLNRLNVTNGALDTEPVLETQSQHPAIQQATVCGMLRGTFTNEEKVKAELAPVSVGAFFEHLREEVFTYYNEVEETYEGESLERMELS